MRDAIPRWRSISTFYPASWRFFLTLKKAHVCRIWVPGHMEYEDDVPEQHKTEWATIGQVVALFGVRGEIKVHALTDIPGRFQTLKTVYIGSEHRLYTIEQSRAYKGDMVLLKLAGIDDANAAESLRTQHLLIPLDQLAELPADNYYQHDILGLTVRTLDQRILGSIIEIMETGSNDVYVIKKPDGKEVLIPALKTVVKRIDLAQRVMLIDPLPGLLEPPTRADVEEEENGSTGGEDDT